MRLKFSSANTKIKRLSEIDGIKPFLQHKRKVYSLDLLSGWTCPFAKECLSKVHVNSQGKRSVRDGKHTKFRCFSASQEARLSNVYNLRKHNTDLLENAIDKFALLEDSLPKNAGVVRIHVGGDIFNRDYFKSWAMLAETRPDVLFYAYTKSLLYWLELRSQRAIPRNLVLTASYGGRCDNLIKKHKLRYSVVVNTEKQAADLGLEIDHDDSHAADPSTWRKSFALLIHGTQPAGSEAGKAVKALNGKGSYGKNSKI